MTSIRKYLAISLFFCGVSVGSASQKEEIDLEVQRAPVVVHQQQEVSQTAAAFLKHGAGDIAFLGATGLRQLSDSNSLQVVFYTVQIARYYQLMMTNYHATSDAMKYKTWPFVFFATAMAAHALGDLAFDIPSLANSIRNSVGLKTILTIFPIIDEWTGAKEGIIGYAATAADSIKTLAVPLAAVTFTLALYRFRHDGTLDVVWNKLKALLLGENAGENMLLSGDRGKKEN